MKGLGLLIGAVIILLTISGCLSPPRLLDPGGERWQQTRAQRFDPYPQNLPGLPSATGTRPSDYREPRAEVLTVQPRKGEAIYTPTAPAPAIAQPQPCPQAQ
jgi:hypothetical protein